MKRLRTLAGRAWLAPWLVGFTAWLSLAGDGAVPVGETLLLMALGVAIIGLWHLAKHDRVINPIVDAVVKSGLHPYGELDRWKAVGSARAVATFGMVMGAFVTSTGIASMLRW